jgi:hypothetical protein
LAYAWPCAAALINRVACELARQGKPEREALFLVIDPGRRAELEAVLKAAKRRQDQRAASAA